MKKKQDQEQRKVCIGLDFAKLNRLKDAHSEVCYLANTKIMPAMEALGFDIELNAVLKYTANPQQLRDDYITRKMGGNLTGNKYLDNIISEKCSQEADAHASIPVRGVPVNYPENFVLIPAEDNPDAEEPVLRYDIEAVNAMADIWISDPAELDAYDRHQAAADALNAFFNGKAPEDWNGKFTGFFGLRDGKIFAATGRGYKQFVKQ